MRLSSIRQRIWESGILAGGLVTRSPSGSKLLDILPGLCGGKPQTKCELPGRIEVAQDIRQRHWAQPVI